MDTKIKTNARTNEHLHEYLIQCDGWYAINWRSIEREIERLEKLKTYKTTKRSCMCPDFVYRKKHTGEMCKHMKQLS